MWAAVRRVRNHISVDTCLLSAAHQPLNCPPHQPLNRPPTPDVVYDYILHTYDSWGDGWNGAVFTWTDSKGATTTGRPNGDYRSFELASETGAGCVSLSVSADDYPTEVSWELHLAETGESIATGGADTCVEIDGDCSGGCGTGGTGGGGSDDTGSDDGGDTGSDDGGNTGSDNGDDNTGSDDGGDTGSDDGDDNTGRFSLSSPTATRTSAQRNTVC